MKPLIVAGAVTLSVGLAACGSSASSGFNNTSTLASNIQQQMTSRVTPQYPAKFSVSCLSPGQQTMICTIDVTSGDLGWTTSVEQVTVAQNGSSWVETPGTTSNGPESS
jgi:hypothetical protein